VVKKWTAREVPREKKEKFETKARRSRVIDYQNLLMFSPLAQTVIRQQSRQNARRWEDFWFLALLTKMLYTDNYIQYGYSFSKKDHTARAESLVFEREALAYGRD